MSQPRSKTVYAGIALVAVALAGLALSRLAAPSDDGAGAADMASTTTPTDDQLVPVRMPRLEGQETIGQKVFQAKCASCHGDTGGGRDGAGPPLIHKVYEPSHHADVAFYMAAEQGVRAHHWKFGNMAPVEGITRAAIADVITFIRAVQRENGIY
ncbi:c-type cytochrome [Aliiroseovarius sediminis]|uniref:c-type cytochrome n=1 Tax=Aliiroseovarius sediminis TaxID=2925839 RepID=UPI001F59EDF4|nr:c-type cytochrome [Aliiroseovarius sediminis]MCI2393461.1 cytochrome c [Aliiroseovarius sediminis]